MALSLNAEQQRELWRLSAALAMGELRPEDAVMFARSLIASGSDSAVVLELAGLPADTARVTSEKALPLFRTITVELGMQIPRKLGADWTTARFIAEGMLAGGVTPVYGANQLWSIARDCGSPPELVGMVRLVDAWEQTMPGEQREAIETEMLVHARAVIIAANQHIPN